MASYGSVKVEGNHFHGEEAAQDNPNVTSTLVKLQDLLNYQAEKIAYLEKRISPVLLPPREEKGELDRISPETSSLRQELEVLCNRIQVNTDYISDLLSRVDF